MKVLIVVLQIAALLLTILIVLGADSLMSKGVFELSILIDAIVVFVTVFLMKIKKMI